MISINLHRKKCKICGKKLTTRQIRKKGELCSRECQYNNNRGKQPPHSDDKYGYDVNFLNGSNEFRSYFIGWFITDGCFSKLRSVLFNISDKEVIDRFVMETKYSNNVRVENRRKKPGAFGYGNSKTLYTIKYSGKVANEIEKLGYFPGPKTGKEFIPEEFLHDVEQFRHLLRGIVEGDGSVYINRYYRKTGQLEILIHSASRSFLQQIHDSLLSFGIVLGGYVKTRKASRIDSMPMYALRFSHLDALRICKCMYFNTDLYLSRKKAKFDEVYKTDGYKISDFRW